MTAGVLSGTPTTTGTSSFTVTATDSKNSGLTGSQAYTLAVNPASSLTVSRATLPNATANIAYSSTLTAMGGSGTYTFAVSSGSLPSWLALNATTGVLSGTPTTTGTSTFTITATDSHIGGLTGSRAYTLTVGTPANPPRPQPTTLNTASSQYQNLVAVFPLWVTSSTADTLDYGPHGLVGTPTNVQVHTDPVMGNVFYASGSASNFAVPYNTYLDFAYPNDAAQPFTISCWVNITIPSTSLTTSDNPANMYVVTFDANDAASYPGYGLGAAATLAANGPITSELDVDGHEAQATMFGSSVINDGKWHLLVATYTPASSTVRPTSTGNIYIDGVLDSTSNSMAELESPTVDSPGGLLNPFSMYVGTDDDGHSNAWQGMFCDLRFYNAALSATQIAAMYAPATRWQLYTPAGSGMSSAVAPSGGAGTQGTNGGIAHDTSVYPTLRTDTVQWLSSPSGSTESGGQGTTSTMMPLASSSSNQPENNALTSSIESDPDPSRGDLIEGDQAGSEGLQVQECAESCGRRPASADRSSPGHVAQKAADSLLSPLERWSQ